MAVPVGPACSRPHALGGGQAFKGSSLLPEGRQYTGPLFFGSFSMTTTLSILDFCPLRKHLELYIPGKEKAEGRG